MNEKKTTPKNLDELTEKEKAERRLNNPTNEIFYFWHRENKYGYILASKMISVETFFQKFPNSDQVSEDKFDELVELHPDTVLVTVGDDNVIDDNFSEIFNPEENG